MALEQESKIISNRKISIEAELGNKGVEKTNVYIYENTKLIETHFYRSFEDIRKIANGMKSRHMDAEVETTCTGEDCMGGGTSVVNR